MTQATTLSAARVRRGLLAPLFLMAVGSTFLAVDLGYIDPHALHELLHLSWPVLLVLIGIELAYARRSRYVALAAEFLVVVVAAIAIAVV